MTDAAATTTTAPDVVLATKEELLEAVRDLRNLVDRLPFASLVEFDILDGAFWRFRAAAECAEVARPDEKHVTFTGRHGPRS